VRARPHVHVEGGQEFTFHAQWHRVQKFDSAELRREVDKLQGSWGDEGKPSANVASRSVDFVGWGEQELILLEVKDFREDPHENVERWTTTSLPLEFSAKVRDSIATLVGFVRSRKKEEGWRDAAAVLADPEAVCFAVLFVEIGDMFAKKRAGAHLRTLSDEIKKKIPFLGLKILVVDRHTNVAELLGITVRDLPAPRPGSAPRDLPQAPPRYSALTNITKSQPACAEWHQSLFWPTSPANQPFVLPDWLKFVR
jgi:hypothetical protein